MENIINVESLAYKGYGTGKKGSKIVFIDYAVPGDVVRADIYEEHKNYAFARIEEIITPSPERIPPACKNFGICGGCSYLNIPYETELYWKKRIFAREFEKTFKSYGYDADKILTGLSDKGPSLYYRRKISLKVFPPFIGFYRKQTHKVIDIESCHLASWEVNQALKCLREIMSGENFLENVKGITLLEAGGIKNAIFELKNGAKSNEEKFFREVFRECGFKNIFVTAGKGGENFSTYRGGPGEVFFEIKGKKFYFDLPAFIQVNKKQNERLIDEITGFLSAAAEERGKIFNSALDLFCGYGNITLFLQGFVKKIKGVDIAGPGIELAKKSLELNNARNITFESQDAEKSLKKEKERGSLYDLVVLDPPRRGVKGMAPLIAGLGPEYVIYVSCDPMTLMRDLKVFAEMDYGIKKISLIDMFPRTYHIESVSFLRKIK